MTASISVLAFMTSAFLGMSALMSSQNYRPPTFILMAIFACISFHNLKSLGLSLLATDTLAMFIMIWSSHIGYTLLIEKHMLPSKSPRDAYFMLFNARFIGTQKQVAVVCLERPSATPSKSAFLNQHLRRMNSPRFSFIIRRLFSLSAIYTIIQLHTYAMTTHTKYGSAPLSSSDFLSSKQVFFRHFFSASELSPSLRELAIRTWFVAYWTGSAYVLYTSLHDILAIFFVCIGLDEPEDWPQLYGKLAEAYSMRRFWGKFWHRLVYRSYTAYASLISVYVLRLPRQSLAGKIVVNLLVFLISGVIHAVVTRHLGFECGYWEDIWFFLWNFEAIVVEMIFQYCFRRACGMVGWRCPGWIVKSVGYTWCFGFLFWSLPKAYWPKMFCVPPEYRT